MIQEEHLVGTAVEGPGLGVTVGLPLVGVRQWLFARRNSGSKGRPRHCARLVTPCTGVATPAVSASAASASPDTAAESAAVSPALAADTVPRCADTTLTNLENDPFAIACREKILVFHIRSNWVFQGTGVTGDRTVRVAARAGLPQGLSKWAYSHA